MAGRKTTLRHDYFSWLYNQVREPRGPYYLKLCAQLHDKKFRWHVHNDDNRCEDGLNLRDQFIELKSLDETHIEVQSFLKGDCTVFELLVALALRMNELLYDLNDRKDHTSRWFLEMIGNLGLRDCTDDLTRDDRHSPVTEAEIDEVLEKFMSRTYDFYGRGGLFPLKRRPAKDQTGVEIWYQLMLYLDENYGL